MKYGALRSAELFHFTVLDGLEIYVCMKGYIVLACKVSLSLFSRGLGGLWTPLIKPLVDAIISYGRTIFFSLSLFLK